MNTGGAVMNDAARTQLEKDIDKAQRDIQFTLGPVDSLDHASRLPNFGSKMGIDATRKHEFPPAALPPRAHLERVDTQWERYGIERS